MQIITAGSSHLDIDAYAGIVAYAELLNAQHIPAKAVSSAPLNVSVSPIVRSWGLFIETAYTPELHDQFTLIDVSEPEFFDPIVKHSHIKEVIDHHMDFKVMWDAKLGDKSQIEYVGAACTLVYERWKQAGLVEMMRPTTAGLLMSGILDNTLNFGAVITTARDHAAYEHLSQIAGLPDDWPAQYFTDCQQTILEDIPEAIAHDVKAVLYPLRDARIYVGQFALWDAEAVLGEHLDTIRAAFAERQPWYMNIISLKDGRSYLLCDNPEIQAWLTETLDVSFDGSLAIANRMWLRKEIMKQATGKE
jgi:inorganic pyrophosphatase/exopolyphosphatase